MRSIIALSALLLSTTALATPLPSLRGRAGGPTNPLCLQCSPFPTEHPTDQTCHPTTICVTQAGSNYCACRGGYRGDGGYSPADTSVQV